MISIHLFVENIHFFLGKIFTLYFMITTICKLNDNIYYNICKHSTWMQDIVKLVYRPKKF